MTGYCRNLCDRFGSAWTRFWFTPGDPSVLSLVRLLTGLVAIWWYLGYFAELQEWFGPGGLLSLQAARDWRTDDTGIPNFAFSIFDYADTSAALWAFYWGGLAVLVMMAAGLFTRITTIASLIVVLSLIHRGPMLARPADDVLAMLMFYLCIGPSGSSFSLDAWLRKPAPNAGFAEPSAQFSSAATVAIRLMQVHVALIYAAMAISQLQGEAWWQGTAVWWLMARPESRLVDLTFLNGGGLGFEYLVNFLTHAIVLYEVCFALLIWNDLARPILLVLGLVAWTIIGALGGWVSFAVLMLIANLAYVRPETLRQWCACRAADTGVTATAT